MKKSYLLTRKRRSFLNQVYNIIDSQFQKQEKNLKTVEDASLELENGYEYIQRIFIDGSWGSGKTYFCGAFAQKIEEENSERYKNGKNKIKMIKINAWETDYFSEPMKSLIGEMNSYGLLKNKTEKIAEKILGNAFKVGGKVLLNFLLKNLNLEANDLQQLKDTFSMINTSELEDYKNYKALVEEFKKALSEDLTPKLIIVDELDRCKPDYAIELLETIKHFFGVKNIIFVFLVNMEQLKSIVSTSYLTNDKCSEYFEKFYDIKFSLPVLEYRDFLEIEYSKYDSLEKYETFKDRGINVTKNVDKFYDNIFFEVFISNCDSEKVSPRNFIKSFRKFKLLISSLSIKEKECYPIMIFLVIYFIQKEFLIKSVSGEEKEEEYSIPLLYLRTFYEKDNLSLCDKVLTEEEINEELSNYMMRLKSKFSEFSGCDFYKEFYLILLYEGKHTEYNSRCDRYINKYVLNCELDKMEYGTNVSLKIAGKKVLFPMIKFLVYDVGILLPKELFKDLSIEIFKIGGQNNYFYTTDILEEWAKEKYSFVLGYEM